MKNKRIKNYIAVALVLVVFCSAFFGLVFSSGMSTSSEVAERRGRSARTSFSEAIVNMTNEMRYLYVECGGLAATELEELYVVTERMNNASSDGYYCIMDPAGNLYADYDRVLYWVGESVRASVDENGYAVTYIHNIFEISGAIATIIPVETNEYYSLMRVVSKESFAQSLADRISEPYDYVAIFNGWGDLVVLNTWADVDVTDAEVQQAAQQYINDGEMQTYRLNMAYDYDVFVPISQPQGWFLSVRVSGTDLMPAFGTQIVALVLAVLLITILGILYIVYDIQRNRVNPSGLAGEIDPLTGLYASPGMEDAIQAFFRRAVMQEYSLVYMDIASFRRFNAMFGHKMGDMLLQAIGTCIKKNFYCGARPNSDIFVFVVDAAANIKTDVEEPIKEAVQTALGPQYLQMISFNFGVYPLLQDKFNFREASDGAMMALRSAKTLTKGNEVIYDLAMLKEDRMNKQIEVNMLNALTHNEFKMYIQPKFNADDVKCCGGEALVRWQSEQMGMLLPYQFIPLFERNGFIVEVDFFMLESIMEFQKSAMEEGLELLPISVNQSRVTISMPNYIERIKELVGRYDVPLEYVDIEITESILTENYDTVVSLVFQLRDIGFSIDMDDFGKGYSSLNTLRELPVDVLKIDKEFLRESDTSQRGRRIIESVISMARSLDIQTICEGVETGMQLDFLRESGCDMVQGYYLSRPIPEDEYIKLFLQDNHPVKLSDQKTGNA